MAASSDDEWMKPPPGVDGAPLVVDTRFAVFKLSNIDTAQLSCRIKIAILWYWTDPRLIGWDFERPLPDKLWGPHCLIVNSTPDFTDAQTQFELCDETTGRIKRGRMFQGTIDNPMDLHDFPFDVDDVKLICESVSHWMCKDGSTYGSMARGQSYSLRHICMPGEGKLVGIYWDGHVSEWEMLGVSVKLTQLPPTPQGTIRTPCNIAFHLCRRYAFYFYKVMLPLYLLATLSFATFFLEVPDIGDRAGVVSTYFLAAFAMLYVVGSYLPTTDYLTKMDYVIISTTGLLAVMGLENMLAVALYRSFPAEGDGESHAQTQIKKADMYFGLGLAAIYIVANLAIFWGPLHRLYSSAALLRTAPHSSDVKDGELPTVSKGATYMPSSGLLPPPPNNNKKKTPAEGPKTKLVSMVKVI